jgi:hypothetical protein
VSGARSFRPATIQDGDVLVAGGRPVVADEPAQPGVFQVDRFSCIECGEPLTVVLDAEHDDGADVVAEDGWMAAGFDRRTEAPDGPTIRAGAEGLPVCSRRVMCASCGTEQVALAASGELEPQRWVTIAHGTAAIRPPGRRGINRLATAVMAVAMLALLGGNVAAAISYWNARLDVRDGERVEAVVLSASERGHGASVVASHSLRVAFSIQSPQEQTIDVDKATFLRYADEETVPVYVRSDRATVAGDHAQRNGLLEMLVIDIVILVTIAGVVLAVRVSARDARREPRA